MNAGSARRWYRRPILLSLNLLPAAFIAWRLATPPHTRLPDAVPPRLEPVSADRAVPARPTASIVDVYETIIARPVFYQHRSYAAPAPEVAALVPPPALALSGYLQIPGRPAKAFLRDAAHQRALVVSVGDAVDGWTVVGVVRSAVTLRQGERTAVLTRSGDLPVRASPAAAAVPRASPVPRPAATAYAPRAALPSPVIAPARPSAPSAGVPPPIPAAGTPARIGDSRGAGSKAALPEGHPGRPATLKAGRESRSPPGIPPPRRSPPHPIPPPPPPPKLR